MQYCFALIPGKVILLCHKYVFVWLIVEDKLIKIKYSISPITMVANKFTAKAEGCNIIQNVIHKRCEKLHEKLQLAELVGI